MGWMEAAEAKGPEAWASVWEGGRERSVVWAMEPATWAMGSGSRREPVRGPASGAKLLVGVGTAAEVVSLVRREGVGAAGEAGPSASLRSGRDDSDVEVSSGCGEDRVVTEARGPSENSMASLVASACSVMVVRSLGVDSMSAMVWASSLGARGKMGLRGPSWVAAWRPPHWRSLRSPRSAAASIEPRPSCAQTLAVA